MHNIESRSYWTGKYTVRWRVCASFSPEIVQAGAVKGLTKGFPSKFLFADGRRLPALVIECYRLRMLFSFQKKNHCIKLEDLSSTCHCQN